MATALITTILFSVSCSKKKKQISTTTTTTPTLIKSSIKSQSTTTHTPVKSTSKTEQNDAYHKQDSNSAKQQESMKQGKSLKKIKSAKEKKSSKQEIAMKHGKSTSQKATRAAKGDEHLKKVEISNGSKKNANKSNEEKTLIAKVAKAVEKAFKWKREDYTQDDDRTITEKRDDVIAPEKVKQMGNLDETAFGLKPEMAKEIEEMRSKHEMEISSTRNSNSLKNKHVIITENKCKLYETNNELTLDDDLDDAEVVLIARP